MGASGPRRRSRSPLAQDEPCAPTGRFIAQLDGRHPGQDEVVAEVEPGHPRREAGEVATTLAGSGAAQHLHAVARGDQHDDAVGQHARHPAVARATCDRRPSTSTWASRRGATRRPSYQATGASPSARTVDAAAGGGHPGAPAARRRRRGRRLRRAAVRVDEQHRSRRRGGRRRRPPPPPRRTTSRATPPRGRAARRRRWTGRERAARPRDRRPEVRRASRCRRPRPRRPAPGVSSATRVSTTRARVAGSRGSSPPSRSAYAAPRAAGPVGAPPGERSSSHATTTSAKSASLGRRRRAPRAAGPPPRRPAGGPAEGRTEQDEGAHDGRPAGGGVLLQPAARCSIGGSPQGEDRGDVGVEELGVELAGALPDVADDEVEAGGVARRGASRRGTRCRWPARARR